VIAKLRGESEQMRTQETGLPPFNLSSLDIQLSGIRGRAYANDSATSSPLASPLNAQFPDYGSAPDLTSMPRSVPLGFGDDISPLGNGGFSQGGVAFPSPWQVSDDQALLQYSSPVSANGYVSVNELAHQIFQEPSILPDSMSYQNSTSFSPAIAGPRSIDALLTGSTRTATSSETGTNTSSPRAPHGPKYLYRSDSGPSSQAEPRLMALASEIGMSGYLMSQCIKQWFRHIYPIHPVLHEPSFLKMLNQSEELSTSEKILILSLCAVTVTHAAPPSDLTLQNKQDLGRELLKQCLHLRHTYEWIETATLTTLISSFFICITYFELKLVRSHHFFLREAIGLAREMITDAEKDTDNTIEAICRKRLLAVLFITERGCAILRNKPISLSRLPSIPTDFFDDHDEIVLAGFTSLCNLFGVLDDKFVELWYATAPEDEPLSRPLDNVAAIQHDLNNLSFGSSKMTEIQKADVLVTHQWLRLVFWQASMRHGLITSTSTDEAFLYNYPILIARDLCQILRPMEYNSILVHGLGIFEKLFEVAFSLMDSLTLAKIEWSTSDDLRYLFGCLSANPNSHSAYVKVLENKINLARNTTQSPIK